MTDNAGVMGYTWCIIEPVYKLQNVGMQNLRQATQNGFLAFSLSLLLSLTVCPLSLRILSFGTKSHRLTSSQN